LRGNPEVAKQLQREAARKGGKSRAAGNKVTEALKGRCFEEFKRLKEEDWAKSDLVTQAKRPVATKIADEIVQRVSCGEGALPDDAVPSPVTLADHVRKWLKNSSADKPLNGS
jgi:hypothetical protein